MPPSRPQQQRNIADYERANLVSEIEAEEMRELAERLREDVSAWMRKRYPDIAP